MNEECLPRLVFLNEGHLRKTISNFIGHYRHRRNHQGIENKLVEPPVSFPKEGRIRCQKQLVEGLRIGGWTRFHWRHGGAFATGAQVRLEERQLLGTSKMLAR